MYEIRLAPSSLQNIWLPMEAEPAKYGFILTATFPESEKESKNRRVRRKQGNAIHLVWAALRGLGVLIRGQAKCPAWLPNGSGPSLRQSALAGSWPPGSPLPPLFLPGPSPQEHGGHWRGSPGPTSAGRRGAAARGAGAGSARLGRAGKEGGGGRPRPKFAFKCGAAGGRGWGRRHGAGRGSGAAANSAPKLPTSRRPQKPRIYFYFV